MRQRQLFLLRHAKSAWNTGATNDFDRPLNKRGKSDAPRTGRWLFDHEYLPDHIICSPAKRACNTLEKIQRVLGFEEQQINWEPRVYGANLETLLAVLAQCDDSVENLLLVGHNPGLEDLLIYLCGSAIRSSEAAKLMPTAAVAIITLKCSWPRLQRGSGTLDSIIRPRSLPDSDLRQR